MRLYMLRARTVANATYLPGNFYMVDDDDLAEDMLSEGDAQDEDAPIPPLPSVATSKPDLTAGVNLPLPASTGPDLTKGRNLALGEEE